MPRIENDYRLGNIIDAWYGREHVKKRNACDFHAMVNKSSGTFGNFLAAYKPRYLLHEPPFDFLKNASEWWWCYFMSNFKGIYPTFNDALRDAIDAYGKCVAPSTHSTCVIHMRVGDFLDLGCKIDIQDIINATSLLHAVPDRFEVLNGGKHFRASADVMTSSDKLLRDLCSALEARFPLADVVLIDSDNADDDFFRMVMAPMLITGAGSFAVFAAAANRNQRLTPALNNLNFVHEGSTRPECIYEDWSTYACSNCF